MRTFCLIIMLTFMLVDPDAGYAGKFHIPSMPEFYATSNAYCVIQFDSTERDLKARKEHLFELLPVLFSYTDKWTTKFAVIGVDYVEFRSFSTTLLNPCSDSRSIAQAVREVHSITSTYTDKVVQGKGEISSVEVLKRLPSPVRRFMYYNPGTNIIDCLISLRVVPSQLASENSRVHDRIVGAWLKYRLPFADVTQINNEVFVLLARDCNDKQEIYDGLRYVLNKDGYNLKQDTRQTSTIVLSDYLAVQPTPVR